jgi:predicted dehydrogenase
VSVGIGVIGTGFVANMHLAAIAKLTDAHLAGVADIDAGRARSAVKGIDGARWTTRVAELLRWPDVGGCIVCTPNDTHVDIGLEVAAAGKDLLMEKPLAITVDGAQTLERVFREKDLVLMGAHTHRFYDYGRTIKRTIDMTTSGDRSTFDWPSWVAGSGRTGARG